MKLIPEWLIKQLVSGFYARKRNNIKISIILREILQEIYSQGYQLGLQDAKRYQYLRNSEEGIEFRNGEGKWRCDCPSKEELDKIIDAAIEKEKNEN